MGIFDAMTYIGKFVTAICVAHIICEAAMYFDKPGLLWWFIVPLLIVETDININKNKDEEDEEDEEEGD